MIHQGGWFQTDNGGDGGGGGPDDGPVPTSCQFGSLMTLNFDGWTDENGNVTTTQFIDWGTPQQTPSLGLIANTVDDYCRFSGSSFEEGASVTLTLGAGRWLLTTMNVVSRIDYEKTTGSTPVGTYTIVDPGSLFGGGAAASQTLEVT
ncbi:MAG TPA: hypothetical protein VFE58_08975 [Tepidisphaeraceae bacterium]|nr:hypothetical protein [Tepidisphaeraceae bacterium]